MLEVGGRQGVVHACASFPVQTQLVSGHRLAWQLIYMCMVLLTSLLGAWPALHPVGCEGMGKVFSSVAVRLLCLSLLDTSLCVTLLLGYLASL